MSSAMPPVAHAGECDCERVRGGFFGQPVNSTTSAAFLAGAVIVAARGSSRRRWWAGVLAWLGCGSIGFHGPGTIRGKQLHDTSIIALVATIAAGVGHRHRLLLPTGACAATALVCYPFSRTVSPNCDPDSPWQLHGAWHVLSAGAITLWALGEAPRCEA